MTAGSVPTVRPAAPNRRRRLLVALWATLVAGPFLIALIAVGAHLQSDRLNCFLVMPPSCAAFGVTPADVIVFLSKPWGFIPASPGYALLIPLATAGVLLAHFAFRGTGARLTAAVIGTLMILHGPTLLRALHDHGLEYRLCPQTVLERQLDQATIDAIRKRHGTRYFLCKPEAFQKRLAGFHLHWLTSPSWLYDRVVAITVLMLGLQLLLLCWRPGSAGRRQQHTGRDC